MAATKYFAKTKVNVDGKVFAAGDEIEGVDEKRCEYLRGRFLETVADRKEAEAASKKKTADAHE